MKRILLLSIATTLIIGGCEMISYDCGESDPDDPWGDFWGDECEDHSDCPTGFSCDDGDCELTGVCGFDGMCAGDLICDEDRDTCVPDDPDGSDGCEPDDECDDGLLCIAALCTDIDEVCLFDFECGPGAICLDNECHAQCECECPVGQECRDGLCMDVDAGAECLFDEDCGEGGSFSCVNAVCHPTCAAPEDCARLGETCQSGICRADTAPDRECASDDDCDADLSCHRGACRLPCAASINCAEPFTTCGETGFCLHPSEVDAECNRAADCPDEGACRDGRCL